MSCPVNQGVGWMRCSGGEVKGERCKEGLAFRQLVLSRTTRVSSGDGTRNPLRAGVLRMTSVASVVESIMSVCLLFFSACRLHQHSTEYVQHINIDASALAYAVSWEAPGRYLAKHLKHRQSVMSQAPSADALPVCAPGNETR